MTLIPDAIKYRWEIRKLFRMLKRCEDGWAKNIAQAKKGGKRDDIDLAIAQCQHETDEIQEDIDLLLTSYLLKTARKLIIPTPAYDNKELMTEARFSRRFILTDKGIHEIRRAIRQENKDRREVVFSWLSMLFGIMGMLIGLISVIKK